MPQPGQLYLVATPIGNLGDITIRALEVLQAVDKIACEDTRHSMILLDHYGIHKPLVALHDHNEERQVQKLLGWLKSGLNVALISDAGTPLISDPGYRMVSTCYQEGIKVVPLPGPCAAVAALSVSGLPTDRFSFIGFLPVKMPARQKQLQALANESRTLIFYESPRRVLSTLRAMANIFGGKRRIVIARELTKTHETLLSLTLDEAVIRVDEDRQQQRGEIVLLLEGAEQKKPQGEQEVICEKILTTLLEELSLKQAVQMTVKITGSRKKMVYDMALSLVNKAIV
ncbi:MAG: 16S rRNA (cytidine(1402)-2'-O)-methyltransferase [Coxiellaceae bacterium]|nr:16S rRNA (cytidine(1402)-2'-O)-methyltransferase [Coxiellaceae bacterium]